MWELGSWCKLGGGKKKAWEVIDYFFECAIQFQSGVKTSYEVFNGEFLKKYIST